MRLSRVVYEETSSLSPNIVGHLFSRSIVLVVYSVQFVLLVSICAWMTHAGASGVPTWGGDRETRQIGRWVRVGTQTGRLVDRLA